MAVTARARSSSLAALLCLMLPGADLAAQGRPVTGLRSRPHLGIGYVASVPTTFLGVSVLGLTPKVFGGAGLYADVKLTSGSPGDSPYYLPGVTVEDAEITYGDMLYQEESDWVSVNVALVYAITGEFAVYGGLGYSKEEHYREYFDDTQTRGNLGYYWVADPAGSGNRVNALGGAFVRLARFVLFQFGAQAQPPGVNVGFTLTFAP